MNVNGGCGRSPWSVTNLCPVVLLWPLARHLDVCVTPRSCALLTTCTVCLLPHTGLYFRKTSAINPSICASMTFHLCACLWECLFPRDDWIFVLTERDYQDVTDQIRGAKCSRIKLQRDKSWWATRFSFPPCVDDLLCPDSVVLTACLCSFCHTKATSSASAHNCLISTMQNWNYLLYCRWIWVFLDVYKLQSSFSLYSLIHTCKSWSHRYGYIYIILYFKIGAFYFRFCSSTKSDVCIPSYIWIYITIIYYLFSSLKFQRVFNL